MTFSWSFGSVRAMTATSHAEIGLELIGLRIRAWRRRHLRRHFLHALGRQMEAGREDDGVRHGLACEGKARQRVRP